MLVYAFLRSNMKFLVAVCLLSAVAAQRRHFNTRPSPNANRFDNQDLRLGLLAPEIGVAPVPGGHQNGFPGGFPGGPLPPARDQSCWCQPVNQVCTDLRPENLNTVTRILNIPGSPTSLSPTGTCTQNQRQCCPGNNPAVAIGNFNNGFGNAGGRPSGAEGRAGQCGVRASFGLSPAFSPTADFAEYPWMAVILGPGDSYIAGGVLISDRFVLTAPHKLTQLRGLSVRLGDYDVSKATDLPRFPHVNVQVKRAIVHPGFNKGTLANDVALLELSEPLRLDQYTHIVPACLPQGNELFVGKRCFVSGWGKDAFRSGHFQQLLQEVDVPVIRSDRCEHLLRRTRLGPQFDLDKEAFICAGGEKDKDACGGDGGSPLVCPGAQGGRWTVAGLVAWGVGCGQENVPAAYVNVAAMTDFIRQYV